MLEGFAFARRINRDLTIDSICTKCYMTAATGKDDVELALAVCQHICYQAKRQVPEHRETPQQDDEMPRVLLIPNRLRG
jgi:hypothetical protein